MPWDRISLPLESEGGTYKRVEYGFELFDHTADLGFRVRALSLAGLIKPASEALYAAIGTLVAGRDAGQRRIEIRDDDAAYLLRDYLTELLVAFEREALIATTVGVVSFEDGCLVADVAFATIDQDQSVLCREVKAVTYHELAIRELPGGFEATVIVDI